MGDTGTNLDYDPELSPVQQKVLTPQKPESSTNPGQIFRIPLWFSLQSQFQNFPGEFPRSTQLQPSPPLAPWAVLAAGAQDPSEVLSKPCSGKQPALFPSWAEDMELP